MSKQANILVVDDEATVREVVRKYLEHEGYRVVEADTGTEALAYLREQRPDLLILDLMLPGMDGFAITRSVRNANEYAPLKVDNDIPIIILTARTSELDRIAGFELGADDYVVKPFSPRELVARVRAVLRRSTSGLSEADEKPLILPELSIDPRSREVKIRSSIVVLTAKEFDLLWWMARHPHQVFTRTQLLNQIWGYEFYGDESTVTVHIRRLREKIELNPSEPAYIQTVWGVGYKFETN
jgi:two-component system, OmpR family, response regulator ResD